MRRLLALACLGGAAWYFYRAFKSELVLVVPLKEEPPPGSRPTGRTTTTTDTSRPGDLGERVGFAVRQFIEILTPGGTSKWVEVDRTKGEAP